MESNVLRHFCYFSHLGWACLFVLKNMFLANVKVIFTLKLNTGDIQHNNNKEIEHKLFFFAYFTGLIESSMVSSKDIKINYIKNICVIF